MKSVCIVIPAYNEQERIASTLASYVQFFEAGPLISLYEVTFLVVLNGCTDNTREVVDQLQRMHQNIGCIEIKEAGKGLAIKTGFIRAAEQPYDFIGFVDADMATTPDQFLQLINKLESNLIDGVIASRYMHESHIFPPRPWIKRWGSKLFYESLITFLFGMRYHDYQCGAKLFKKEVIKKVAPRLTVAQWAFDVELLYWCKRLGFSIKEVPTIWHDKAGSKLKIFGAGLPMLSALLKLRWQFWRKKVI